MTNYPVKCPECGNTEEIHAQAEVTAYIIFAKPDDDPDFDLTEYSEVDIVDQTPCQCNKCQHDAPYIRFKISAE